MEPSTHFASDALLARLECATENDTKRLVWSFSPAAEPVYIMARRAFRKLESSIVKVSGARYSLVTFVANLPVLQRFPQRYGFTSRLLIVAIGISPIVSEA